MPIYEYGCDKCGEITEVFQKMSDPAPSKCEHCGSKRIKKQMSRTSFQLKGDGWYITDYARKGRKDGGEAKGEKADTASSGDKKTEKKTETSSKGEGKKTKGDPPKKAS